MKRGVIATYNAETGIGVIFVNSIVGEQYFFYSNRIVSGQPAIGAQVIFKVSTKQPRPGHFPYAAQIIVLPRVSAASEILLAAKAGGDEVSS
jgi:hypothetical protein